jgi:RHS repeat-associated protein
MWKLDFVYDAQGRRIQKISSQGYWYYNYYWQIGWSPLYTNTFIYEGWNLVAELTGASPSTSTLLRSYTWGTDLSGSLQGAGGVGGLLALSYHGAQTTNCFVAYDGNGDVAALVDAGNGTVAAQYDYGPFGETPRGTGPMARANALQCSTKYRDNETGLDYYGYRYYGASVGRWINRDPITEKGGINMYAFVRNSPTFHHDRLGLYVCPPPQPAPPPPPGTACCDGKTIDAGYKILKKRWLDATKFLDDANVSTDPEGESGVSCIESANRILAFMSPIPKCWKCYVHRRGWNWNFWDPDDENSIRCDPVGPSGGLFFTMIFDWWYDAYSGIRTHRPEPLWLYSLGFPYDIDPPRFGWWTKDYPAPHDDCLSKSQWDQGPENYGLWLQPLVDRYGRK